MRRRALAAAGGLDGIRGARIDDVALGRLLKGDSVRCGLGLSASIRGRRPYPRLADLWDMIARSAYTQLRYSQLPWPARWPGCSGSRRCPRPLRPAGWPGWPQEAAATPA